MLLKKTKLSLVPILFQQNFNKINTKFPKGFLLGKLPCHGRNNTGKITVFNRGSGVKKKYRIIDFVRYI